MRAGRPARLGLRPRLVAGGGRAPGGGLGERGAAAVEFALVGPMFLGLIAVLLIFSAILFLQSVLEGAVRDASRFGITGGETVGMTREARIRQIVEARTYGLLDTDSIELETLIYQSFDQVGQPEPFTDENGNGAYDEGEPFTDVNGSGAWEADMGTAGVGGPNDIVVYRVSYDWGLIIPMVKDIFGAEAVTLRANIAVRNEPFPELMTTAARPWLRLRHRLGGLRPAQAGNIAVEFALALPVLVVLMLGVVEISRFTYLNQKLGRTSSTVADLIARAASIRESDLSQIFLAAAEVASPFELDQRAVVIVTSITRPVGSEATIAWQRSGVGSLSATSKVGTEGGSPTLDDGFVLSEGETVIVAETYFDFEPLLGETILGPRTLYSRSQHRARKSALSSIEPS